MSDSEQLQLEKYQAIWIAIRSIVSGAIASHDDVAPALMALAHCAGDLIAGNAPSGDYLEEGFEMFDALVKDHARTRFLELQPPSGAS